MVKSKAEKTAEKALETARVAVGDAEKAVKKLDKKSKREAEALAARLQQATKDAKNAVHRSQKTASAGTPGTTTTASTTTGGSSTGIPTFRDLRDRAKDRGIQGYSRMNKAQLLHALGEG
ncbi:hypothetical protein [Leifsonia xyli]|uniref:hypothetical protein n=1 Tax=Leifsonia xyli TaxID=1575 RepID=UPI003D66CFEB